MTQQQHYEAYRHTAEAWGIDAATRALIYDLAKHGRSSKVEIGNRLGWGERKIRKNVELARRVGIPIVSSSGASPGYWLASSGIEISEFIAREIDSRLQSLSDQRRRLNDTAQALAALDAGVIQQALL